MTRLALMAVFSACVFGVTVPGAAAVPARPDLTVEWISLDADNYLTVAIYNTGTAAITNPGTARLWIAVDGTIVREYLLADLSDQTYRQVQGRTGINTGVRLSGTRYVLAHVDPTGPYPVRQLQELNEYNNVMSLSLQAPSLAGIDAALFVEVGAQHQLIYHLANTGDTAMPAGLPLSLQVFMKDGTGAWDLSFPRNCSLALTSWCHLWRRTSTWIPPRPSASCARWMPERWKSIIPTMSSRPRSFT
jgi:hypothetical protein